MHSMSAAQELRFEHIALTWGHLSRRQFVYPAKIGFFRWYWRLSPNKMTCAAVVSRKSTKMQKIYYTHIYLSYKNGRLDTIPVINECEMPVQNGISKAETR